MTATTARIPAVTRASGVGARSEILSRRERGYVLLSLLLGVSLLVIAAAAIAPTIASQIRRDRETELIHRAAEYRRAVRRFARQTGRYPMSLDDLESTHGIRYLRKRYKDPISGGDFRLLHLADIPASLGTSANNWSLQPAPNTKGESSDPKALAEDGNAAQDVTPSSAVVGTDAHAPGSLDASAAGPSPDHPSGDQPFRGGVIIGVASTSKRKTIREFDRRSHYNQWLFFYDPAYERPFEVHGPTPLTHPPQAVQNAAGAQSADSLHGTPAAPSVPPSVAYAPVE